MSRRKRTALIFAYIFAAVVAVFAVRILFFSRGCFEVIFADVGQGDASVILTKHYKTVLIDGGTSENGKYALTDILRQNGIAKVSAAFISHMQEDHVGGIVELIEQGTEIERLYVGECAAESDGYSDVERAAETHGIPVNPLSKGEVVDIDGAVFTVLSSGDAESSDENDNMQVLRCDIGSNSILFAGDATKKLEEQLAENPLSDTDILKVPHHGSSYSSSESFISAVSPTLSVISVGKNNRFGHPDERTLKALDNAGSAILRTDLDGTVSIIMTEDDILDIRTAVGR